MKKESEELSEKVLAQDAAPQGKLLYRPAEVAGLLSISRSRCYELINSGVIPAVRLGKSVRIPAHLLAEFVRNLSAENDVAQAGTGEGWRHE